MATVTGVASTSGSFLQTRVTQTPSLRRSRKISIPAPLKARGSVVDDLTVFAAGVSTCISLATASAAGFGPPS